MISSTNNSSQDVLSSSANFSRSISDDLLRISTSEDEIEIPISPVKKYPQSIIAHRIEENGKISFLVKYRNRSYYELEWLKEKDLINLLPNVSLIRNYEKFQNMSTSTLAPFFKHEYLIPEKIITEQVDDGQIKYMIKWLGLEYEDSTWESVDFFVQHNENFFDHMGFENQKNDIDLYKLFNDILNRYHAQSIKPSDKELKIPNWPSPDSFVSISQSNFPKSKSGLEVRPYQVEGVNFIMKQWYNRKNAILADEMGLGKTLQSLVFLNMLVTRQKVWGPFLIIVPLSTISNWEREAKEWTNLRQLSFYGSKTRRRLITQNELFYIDTNILKTQILFTTYDYAIKKSDLFNKVDWQVIIIDEAHRIKNSKSKLFTSIMQFKTNFKLLLTGTPLQNNINELWSLLHYLDSEKFNNSEKFNEKFGNLNETQKVKDLQNILRPLMLRRLKGDVEKSISPVEEIIIECPMTQHQMAYYSSIYQQNIQYLTRGAHNNFKVNFRNICMELRKCCNHPYLINGAEDQILVERREAEKHKINQGQNEKDHDSLANEEKFELESLIRSSGKMILLDKLLAKLKKDGHRILIFSQMVKMLDIIQDYLALKGYKSQRIDGCIRGEVRQRAIDEFNNPQSTDFIFLLGTKAGGVGINLASADTVIIYDSDWNPQNDIQATARCHRIGQTKDVKVYRFLTANSYERTLFNKASLKLGLDTAVLQEAKKLTPKQTDQIEKMLKLGAYYAFAEEDKDKEEIQKISEEDIDSILKRSQRIKYDHTASSVEGSTFSKLQFEIEPDSSLDLSAPKFWKKYIPKETKQTRLIKKKILSKRDEQKQKQPSVFADTSSLPNDPNSESESDNDDEFDTPYSSNLSQPKKNKKNHKLKRTKSNQSLFDEGDIEDNCKVVDWTLEELETLFRLLITFGLGRWQFLYDHSGNVKRNHDVQDLRRASLSIAQYIIKSDNQKMISREKVFLKEIFLKPQHKNLLNFIEKFVARHSEYLKIITTSDQSNSISLILLLYFLNEIIHSCKNPPDDIPIPPSMMIAKATKWWTVKDDKILLYHIWKYGFNEFTNIRFTHSFNEKDSPNSKRKNKKNDDKANDEDNEPISESVKFFLSRRVMHTLLDFKELFTTYHDRMANEKNIVYNSQTLAKAINMWTIKEQKNVISAICNVGINDMLRCYNSFDSPKRSLKEFTDFVYNIIEICNSICHGDMDDLHMSKNELLPLDITKTLAEKVLIRVYVLDKLTKMKNISSFSAQEQGIIKYIKSNGFVDLQDCPEATQKFKIDNLSQSVNKFILNIFGINPSKSSNIPVIDLDKIKSISSKNKANDSDQEYSTKSKAKRKYKKKINEDSESDESINENPKNKKTRKYQRKVVKSDYSDENEEEEEEEVLSPIKPIKSKRKNKFKKQIDDYDDNDDDEEEEEEQPRSIQPKKTRRNKKLAKQDSDEEIDEEEEDDDDDEYDQPIKIRKNKRKSRFTKRDSDEDDDDDDEFNRPIRKNKRKTKFAKQDSDDDDDFNRPIRKNKRKRAIKNDDSDDDDDDDTNYIKSKKNKRKSILRKYDDDSNDDEYDDKDLKHKKHKRKTKFQLSNDDYSDDDDDIENDYDDEELNSAKSKRKNKRKGRLSKNSDDDEFNDDEDDEIVEIGRKRTGEYRTKSKKSKKNEESSDVEFTGSYSHENEDSDSSNNALLPLPIQNNLVIVSLGHIVTDRPGFHNDKYYYPPGFVSEHLFPSLTNPNEKVWYRSLIIDKGDSGPVFRVEMKADPSISFEGKNPTNPWMQLVKAVDDSKKKLNIESHSKTSISGPLYFGFAVPEVKKMIKALLNTSNDEKKPFIKKEEKFDPKSIEIPKPANKAKPKELQPPKRIRKANSSKGIWNDDNIPKSENSTKRNDKIGHHHRKNKDKTSSSSQPYSSPLSDESEGLISVKNRNKTRHKKNMQFNGEYPSQSLKLHFDKIDFDFTFKKETPTFTLNTKAVDKLLRERFKIPPDQDPIKYAKRNNLIL